MEKIVLQTQILEVFLHIIGQFPAQFLILFQSQVFIKSKNICRCLAGSLQDIRILINISQLKFQQPALTDSKQIPGATQLQIFSCNIKPIIRFIQDLQTL